MKIFITITEVKKFLKRQTIAEHLQGWSRSTVSFFQGIELTKLIAQGIVALVVAYLGARWGFWGTLRSENYKYRVEAAACLSRDAIEIPQAVQALCEAYVRTYHYRAAWAKLKDEKARDISESWNHRSEELTIELARLKGRLHESLSRVRILFARNSNVQLALSELDSVAVNVPGSRTSEVSTAADLERIANDEVRKVQEQIAKMNAPLERLARTVENELLKGDYGNW